MSKIDKWASIETTKKVRNTEIANLEQIDCKIYGYRDNADGRAGFDFDLNDSELLYDEKIRIDLWSGGEFDLVGKIPTADIDVVKGDIVVITHTFSQNNKSRGLEESQDGQNWRLEICQVRKFGGTTELGLRYA